jgi:hypothetical protein
VSAGESEFGHHGVIKSRALPRRSGMAGRACSREPRLDMAGICRLGEIARVAREAVRRDALILSAQVATGAFQMQV